MYMMLLPVTLWETGDREILIYFILQIKHNADSEIVFMILLICSKNFSQFQSNQQHHYWIKFMVKANFLLG